MTTADVPMKSADDSQELRTQWIDRLSALVKNVDDWGRELGWATRRIEKKMEDSRFGDYKAPALLLQKETVRVILDPVARSAPGAEGVVDLYLMPAWDDIASLFHIDGEWRLRSSFTDFPNAVTVRETAIKRLDKPTLEEVLDKMIKNAQ